MVTSPRASIKSECECEREAFRSWIGKIKNRSPIAPPSLTPRDANETPSTSDADIRKRAKELLLAAGTAVRVLEVVAEGDGTELELSGTRETLYRVSATTSRGVELVRFDDTLPPRRCVLRDEFCDVTRGLELLMRNMGAGARWRARCDWSVTYGHASAIERNLARDSRVKEGDSIVYDVEVLNHVPVHAVKVREPEDGSDVELDAGGRARCTKKTTTTGSGWETPRPPFEVAIEVSAMLIRSGEREEEEFVEKKTVSYVVGDGKVPLALDTAVRTMRLYEEALVWTNYGGFGKNAKFSAMSRANRLVPALPRDESELPDGVAYKVKLVSMRQVRDVFNDGTTKKTRTRDGRGIFPSDCPMNDCMVRVHFVLSTATSTGTHSTLAKRYDTRSDAALQGKPFEFRLGCGALPEALETSIRLMIPKEESRVVLDQSLGQLARERGYGAENCRPDAPGSDVGSSPSVAIVQWDVVLESFDAAVNWYKADVNDMLEEALIIKEEANALFKTGTFELARAKYEKTLHKLESLRGLDDKDFERVETMKITLALNLVASLQKLHQHVEALRRVNKLLEANPENAKALFRRSVSHLALHEFIAARDDLFACLDANPTLQSTVAKQLNLVKRTEQQVAACERANFKFNKLF